MVKDECNNETPLTDLAEQRPDLVVGSNGDVEELSCAVCSPQLCDEMEGKADCLQDHESDSSYVRIPGLNLEDQCSHGEDQCSHSEFPMRQFITENVSVCSHLSQGSLLTCSEEDLDLSEEDTATSSLPSPCRSTPSPTHMCQMSTEEVCGSLLQQLQLSTLGPCCESDFEEDLMPADVAVCATNCRETRCSSYTDLQQLRETPAHRLCSGDRSDDSSEDLVVNQRPSCDYVPVPASVVQVSTSAVTSSPPTHTLLMANGACGADSGCVERHRKLAINTADRNTGTKLYLQMEGSGTIQTNSRGKECPQIVSHGAACLQKTAGPLDSSDSEDEDPKSKDSDHVDMNKLLLRSRNDGNAHRSAFNGRLDEQRCRENLHVDSQRLPSVSSPLVCSHVATTDRESDDSHLSDVANCQSTHTVRNESTNLVQSSRLLRDEYQSVAVIDQSAAPSPSGILPHNTEIGQLSCTSDQSCASLNQLNTKERLCTARSPLNHWTQNQRMEGELLHEVVPAYNASDMAGNSHDSNLGHCSQVWSQEDVSDEEDHTVVDFLVTLKPPKTCVAPRVEAEVSGYAGMTEFVALRSFSTADKRTSESGETPVCAMSADQGSLCQTSIPSTPPQVHRSLTGNST